MVREPAHSTAAARPVIAILLGAPFTAQNYDRTGIPYLREHFEVVVLDCNPWLSVGYRSLRFVKHDYPKLVTVSSPDEFEQAVGSLKPAYAIDFIGLGAATRFIQRTLRRHGARFVVQRTGTLSTPSLAQRTRGHLALALRNPRAFLAKALGKLGRYVKESRPLEPDVALLAGRKSLDSYTAKAKTILWIASRDYYTYKRVQESASRGELPVLHPGRYALFIDDCIASASDYTLLAVAAPIAPETYYPLLLEAFDRLERAAGLPVVVAAHPNGREIERYASLFGGRPVFFDATAELCQRSELVFSHASTGLGYAVLWKKPLLVLTSRALDGAYQGAVIREVSRQLDCPLLFMEADDAQYRAACERSARVSAEAYEAYTANFIASAEVAEAAPWQAFTNFVRQHWAASRP
jgi:hypothetical protein